MFLHLLGAMLNLLVSTKMESLLLCGSTSDKLLIWCSSRERRGIPSHPDWELIPFSLLQCIHVNQSSTSELRSHRKMRCRRLFLQRKKIASIMQENWEIKHLAHTHRCIIYCAWKSNWCIVSIIYNYSIGHSTQKTEMEICINVYTTLSQFVV